MDAVAHTDLTGIAVVALVALVCGLGLERLRQPAIVGYIVAGVMLGPDGFALVENRGQIDVLAELGVLMLLFVVGMELSLRIFRRLWRLAVLATLFQIGASTAVMLLLSTVLGWPFGLALVLGFVVALSSTAVAIKVLENTGELRTRTGRLTVGVLIAQDLAVVPMLLAIGALAEATLDWLTVVKIVGSMGFLAWLIWFLSRGPRIHLPLARVVAGNAALTPLAILAFCFGAAALSGLIGMTAAYGAFLAGLVIGNSHERQAMAANARPIESILIMVFFLSIGLLIDLAYIWDNLGTVILLFFLAAVFKTVLNVGVLRALGQTWLHAFLAGVMLAQIGEFSFLLALTGVQSGLIAPEDGRLVVAVTVLSLALSPLWVVTARRLRQLAEDGITSARELLRLVYGPEAEMVAVTYDGARAMTLTAARRLAEATRRLQQARAAKAAPPAKTTPSAKGAAARESAKTSTESPTKVPERRRSREKRGDA
ncbi:MAG: cation:proton antiporter [Rhodospirillales bacterium]|jgi:CPA2 family monovalent cation:H+ antiporter-2|nr:cation:proton antiporter [Rhodospirillales bacterium]MDP6772831.1 cation:proton antiporter [Rhodospirillales bacterium]